MDSWIQEAGGPAGAAARIAPVIRGIFANHGPLHVRYSEEATGGALPAGRSAVIIPAAAASDNLETIYANLKQAVSGPAVDRIEIAGLGYFDLLRFEARPGKQLDRRVCLVTGAAQGFGEGIARDLAESGASVVIADMNLPRAEAVARSIIETWGENSATALPVDVGKEEDVRALMEKTVLHFGGLDLLVSNAGILLAGGLEEIPLADFERLTRVNYTAFFLVAKYGSRPMKLQARFDPEYTADIVQINSKSGLEGSNRNFAYAGSKFGGIGLVQSFAKELVGDRIKVNAVCPGNYYEGPLWSDPEKGLFVQYLQAGKVAGARSVKDIYDHYVAQVPMRRGCTPADVARAIRYCVEQQYETGQAIPVTGGQNMLS